VSIAFGPKKHHHVAAVGVFLIVATLVVGIIACDGAGSDTYQLTISSTSGGNVTLPGEGTFPYDAGTVVPLAATPDEGYRFRSWTGDIAYIANPSAASTTITMNGNYVIVANFATENQTGPDNGGHIQP
jgi:hypothetical protein